MRQFQFPVDVAHAKSVNETMADVRRLRVSAIVTAVVLIGAGIWFFWMAHPWSYILGAVFLITAATSLWVTVWAPRKVGTVEDLYAKGGLVPAVIAEKRARGVTLLALVDIAKPDADTRHFALVTRSIRTLPGHELVEGELVPSISVLADRNKNTIGDTWQMVSPMPIAWGTTDKTIIARATAEISDEEWALLVANIGLSAKVREADNQQLLVDPHDLPDDL
ncbi:DUF3239 domain-containing protein [Rhodococcus sp. BP-252]|nr:MULTISPECIES: DUF3239 domain-containing protein [Rhodococcus]NIL76747.1 hypothetical protein [Rhodococcus sp. B10]MBY6412695.1 DUF3239 domain-containing protein [Rhodococcus sp. BP-320]MBY6417507.1 DUF3239 domain-containing protein [Rhodococcus sp. BP-321]MBY6421715.1 DUF3239 domain-containing protein [Rhodococcus sp. BP-324]MBY6427454.1 DUF3239 domain-containing protein [Rhodococcus sp. BP-323]